MRDPANYRIDLSILSLFMWNIESGNGIINYKRVKQTPTWLRRSMCRCDPHQYVISLIIYVFIYRTCKCYVYGECVEISQIEQLISLFNSTS